MLWKGFQRPKRLELDHYYASRTNMGGSMRSPSNAVSERPSAMHSAGSLLSSIEGAAITAVKIEGVLHEFSPIRGSPRGYHGDHSQL